MPKFTALKIMVHRCIFQFWFERKLIDYLIYNVVDEILSFLIQKQEEENVCK